MKTHKASPLKTFETLQAVIAKFKARARKTVTHCCDKGDEDQLRTCYARADRFEELAIMNKHAGIPGMPK